MLRFVYLANILVAGAVGLTSLLAPARAARSVWQGTVAGDDAAVRVVGAFWCAVALLSLVALRAPERFTVLLLVQLCYKGSWLLAVAAPALARGDASRVPGGIAAFFVAWVAVLPFVIPWRELLDAR